MAKKKKRQKGKVKQLAHKFSSQPVLLALSTNQTKFSSQPVLLAFSANQTKFSFRNFLFQQQEAPARNVAVFDMEPGELASCPGTYWFEVEDLQKTTKLICIFCQKEVENC